MDSEEDLQTLRMCEGTVLKGRLTPQGMFITTSGNVLCARHGETVYIVDRVAKCKICGGQIRV